jgi:HKD family nuclease
MKVLTTTKQMVLELRQLFSGYSSCEIAVAWASKGFEGFDLLLQHRSKIGRMIVGTHFYQTDPEFIQNFITDEKVRFVMQTDGVFHPKVYLFTKDSGEWECLIGSPNFTRGGFERNEEVAVLITSLDAGAETAFLDVRKRIGDWQKLPVMTHEDFAAYREAWKRKQSLLRGLESHYGKSKRGSNSGYHPLKVEVLQMTWSQYFEMVRTEPTRGSHSDSLKGRLHVIRAVRQWFRDEEHFKNIAPSTQQKIAGFVTDDNGFFLWFGSMRGAGKFESAINNKSDRISLALDVIPRNGTVTRDAYLTCIETLGSAFSSGGINVATATRLLAMKRPDYFLCFNNRNKQRLCGEFGIKKSLSYEEYWDLLIEKVINEAPWWHSTEPQQKGDEQDVWRARMAFLDAKFYDGKDMPDS